MNKIDKKRITMYLVLTFVITFTFEIFAIIPFLRSSHSSEPAIPSIIVGSAMLIPTICVFITRIVTKEGFKNSWIKPVNFKKNLKYYIAGFFGPSIMILLGTAIYFFINPDKFDGSMSYLSKTLETAGKSVSDGQLTTVAIAQIVSAIFLSPIINIISCFGEEWGWRGYLVPKLHQSLSATSVMIISGLIWGLWHIPLICIGQNFGTDYPGFPYVGIFAMCIFCIIVGIFFSYITLKSGSCLPAALAHGSVNGMGAVGAIFSTGMDNPFIGPGPSSILGGSIFIVVSIILLFKVRKEHL